MPSNVRRNGAFAPLGAHYADDDAVTTLDADEDDRSELLYLRALAYCARTPQTDGYVSFIALDAGRVLRRKPGRKGADTVRESAERLADLGLWTREGNGYRIAKWLKWNRSWEEISYGRVTDAARKRADIRVESVTTLRGIRDDSGRTPGGVVTPQHSNAQHSTAREKTSAAAATVDPPGFADFYDTYPRHIGRPDAKRAYTKACRTTTPDVLIDAVKRFAAEASRKQTEPEFIPHPASWLNKGRWTDEPAKVNGRPQSGQAGYDPHKEHLANW